MFSHIFIKSGAIYVWPLIRHFHDPCSTQYLFQLSNGQSLKHPALLGCRLGWCGSCLWRWSWKQGSYLFSAFQTRKEILKNVHIRSFFLPARQCPPIDVDNSVQVVGNPEEAAYGNVLRFSCKSRDEILSGSQELYCDENGKWNGKAPICEGTAGFPRFFSQRWGQIAQIQT